MNAGEWAFWNDITMELSGEAYVLGPDGMWAASLKNLGDIHD
jgi:hypothetical protein